MTNSTTENLDFTSVRGATKIVIAAKAGDANQLSAVLFQRKDAMGHVSGSPLTAQDGYATVSSGLVTEGGDTIAANTLNNADSGTVAAGRFRSYDFGSAGCPWNTLRLRITAGASTITNLSIDAFVFHPDSPQGAGNFVAD